MLGVEQVGTAWVGRLGVGLVTTGGAAEAQVLSYDSVAEAATLSAPYSLAKYLGSGGKVRARLEASALGAAWSLVHDRADLEHAAPEQATGAPRDWRALGACGCAKGPARSGCLRVRQGTGALRG